MEAMIGFGFQSPWYEMKWNWVSGAEEVARLSTIVPSKLLLKHFEKLHRKLDLWSFGLANCEGFCRPSPFYRWTGKAAGSMRRYILMTTMIPPAFSPLPLLEGIIHCRGNFPKNVIGWESEDQLWFREIRKNKPQDSLKISNCDNILKIILRENC